MAFDFTAPQDPDVVALAKAIKNTETPGGVAVPGQTGEIKSRYQFEPATWKAWSKQYLGDENAPVTNENENKVAYARIKEWKDQNYKPDQIASMWNSGKPDWRGNVGYNNGVKYDTPAYVAKVGTLYKQYKGQAQSQTQPTMPPIASQTAPKGPGGILGALGSVYEGIGQAGLGAGKQILSDISGASALGEKGLRALGLPGVSQTPAGQQVQQSGVLAPQGTAQKVGAAGATAAEFLAPTGIEAGAVKTAETLAPTVAKYAPGLLKMGARALGGALDIGGREALRSGGDVQKTTEAATAGAIAAPIAGGLSEVLGSRAALARKTALEDLLSPVETKAVRQAAVEQGRVTEPGLLRKSKVLPSTETKRLASEVADVVNPSKTPQQNVLQLNKKIADVSQKEVKPFLDASKRGFNVNQMKARLTNLQNAKPLRFISEPAEGSTYKKIIETALDTVKENPKNASGLWKARQQFDRLVENMSPKAFDAPDKTNFNIAVNNVRREMNSMIGDLSDSATFKAKMNQLSDYYQARDVLSEKGAKLLGKSKLQTFAEKYPVATKLAKYTGAGILGGEVVHGAGKLLSPK